jgi:hypothetical protein
MKKYYIIRNGYQDRGKFIGNFKNIDEAKNVAFDKMNICDELVGIEENSDVERKDKYGIKLDMGKMDRKEILYLYQTEGNVDGIPEGLYFWQTDFCEIYGDKFYNSDGKVWRGNVGE